MDLRTIIGSCSKKAMVFISADAYKPKYTKNTLLAKREVRRIVGVDVRVIREPLQVVH